MKAADEDKDEEFNPCEVKPAPMEDTSGPIILKDMIDHTREQLRQVNKELDETFDGSVELERAVLLVDLQYKLIQNIMRMKEIFFWPMDITWAGKDL